MTLRWDRSRYRGSDGAGALPNAAIAGQNNSGPSVNSQKATGQILTWGELGCPREIGLYRAGPHQIRVKKIHIIVAENDPAALFTVIELRPPIGPPEFQLGHRVA